MSKQKPISPSAQRELDRLYNQYENRIISVEEYEIRRRELFSKLGGIPSPNKNRSNINPKSLKKQKVDKPQDDYGKIKKIFPILLIGLVLIGVSFKVIPGLEEKGSIIVRTIEESLPKEIVSSNVDDNNNEDYTPPIPQITVPPPVESESTVTTPVNSNAVTSTTVDNYLALDTSTHIYTTEEASSITYGLQSKLGIAVPRIMSFGTPSLYKGEGIINTSVVKGGYYLFSDKPKADNNIILTVFVIEPGSEAQFFKQLSNYMEQFDLAYNITSTYYEKISGPTMTTSPSIQYQYRFYPKGDSSFVSNVRLLAIKRSNLVIYAYYLDNNGNFSLQKEYEERIIDYLMNFN